MIGKLERVPLREVWPHETLDFSRWLTGNLDLLTDVIGRPLFIAETEVSAGDLSVDIIAQDEFGEFVIIENQLERSDHQHLGQLISYIAAFDAAVAVWIVGDGKSSHVTAVNWLNRHYDIAVYLVRIDLFRIGLSEPAPLLSVIAGPKGETMQIGHAKKKPMDHLDERQLFWGYFLNHVESKSALFQNVSAGKFSHLSASAGASRLSYTVRFTKEDTTVELYFNRLDASENRLMFEFLQSRRDQIEAHMGAALDWDDMDGRQACRIRFNVGSGGSDKPIEEWPAIAGRTAAAMGGLEQSIAPHLLEAIELNKII